MVERIEWEFKIRESDYIRGKYEIVANNIPSVLIVLLRKKTYSHACTSSIIMAITFHVESVRKKMPLLFLHFSFYEKERSHYSSKKDEDDGIHYTFVDDIGCCSKLNVVILAGLTAGVACSERYSYPVQ